MEETSILVTISKPLYPLPLSPHYLFTGWCNSTRRSVIFISAWDGPILDGSSLMLARSSFSLRSFLRTWPNSDTFHSVNASVRQPSFCCTSRTQEAFSAPLQTWSTTFTKSGWVSYINSYQNILSATLFGARTLEPIASSRMGPWSAPSCQTYFLLFS